jgi:hypothetical protein
LTPCMSWALCIGDDVPVSCLGRAGGFPVEWHEMWRTSRRPTGGSARRHCSHSARPRPLPVAHLDPLSRLWAIQLIAGVLLDRTGEPGQ